MRKSIKYLPKDNQEDLGNLVSMVLERIPQTEMIILYGSYATGKYVGYDSRIEFGVRTTFMSDYDILVVTHGARDKEVGQRLDNIEEMYYQNPDRQTPVQFINDDIRKLNRDLSDGRYFYTQLKEEGVVLYDTGKFKLARRRKLRYDEIKQQAEEYYIQKYQKAEKLFIIAEFSLDKGFYNEAVFNLHQSCENLFHAVRLVFTLENSKQHNLSKLLASVRKYSIQFGEVFSRNTEEEKRLFYLLKSAYIEARYNPDFLVTREDIETLMVILKRFFGLVESVCEQRIRVYGEILNRVDEV